MEMTYDGVLVMPSSYAVMDEEEMTYVDGGSVENIVDQLIATAIVAGVAALHKKVTFAKVIGFIKYGGAAAKALVYAIKGCYWAKFFGAAVICAVAGTAIALGIALTIKYVCK